MTGMNINLPRYLDRRLSLYKILKNKKTKQDALIEILEDFFIQNPTLLLDLVNCEKKGENENETNNKKTECSIFTD